MSEATTGSAGLTRCSNSWPVVQLDGMVQRESRVYCMLPAGHGGWACRGIVMDARENGGLIEFPSREMHG